jgi:hypothetical protein
MRRTAKMVLGVAVVLVVLGLFLLPVVNVSAPGATNGLQIHFTQSLDCYLLGARPGQWIGVYYFQGGLGIGCGPLLV